MNPDKRSQYITRDAVMNLLSDEEVARVSTAETAANLVTGDEFVDLEHLDKGVMKGPTAMPLKTMGTVLPRKAVADATWQKIVARLPNPPQMNHVPKTKTL